MKADNKMKILTSELRWVDATFDTQRGQIVDLNGNRIRERKIISIENDVRGKYVQCRHCHTYILNTPKSLQEHRALSSSKEACFKCSQMVEHDRSVIKQSYVQQEDGSYVSSTKATCGLVCTYSYRAHDIDSDSARTHCRYAGCSSATVQPFEDVFTKYPGVFDELATADALDGNVWKYEEKSGDHYIFRAVSRYNIKAYVRKEGIIDLFTYSSRYTRYIFKYSKTYNKLFWLDDDNYTESCSVSGNVKSQLLKLVSEIYNKEN